MESEEMGVVRSQRALVAKSTLSASAVSSADTLHAVAHPSILLSLDHILQPASSPNF